MFHKWVVVGIKSSVLKKIKKLKKSIDFPFYILYNSSCVEGNK